MMILVGIGGSLGAGARFYLGGLLNNRWGVFPAGTWLVNIMGSLLLGMMVGLHTQGLIPGWLWVLGGAGFCGAFTTFSTFGHETVLLLRRGKIGMASIYVITSSALSILAVFLAV
ncbi:fluoride efflux transporter CrcB [Virgibacillus xinjiangensis]|uniref:Fluoride-specific ion channel FluC n=1 Tax=Virgibacillus xinjiangensis TaxID=393090 RepID=A0ABV7CVC9_9BACI